MNKKVLGIQSLLLFALALSACTNSSSEVEESDLLIDDTPDELNEVAENSEIESVADEDLEYYENTAFAYRIGLADGYDVSTEEVAMMPVVHDESIWIRVEFDDGGSANLDSMENSGTFPELRDGRIDLSAEEYVEAWWEDNKNSDNPNTQPVLGQVFQKTFNDVTWHGFVVEDSIVLANSVGGSTLQKPQMVLVAKNDGVFYRWQFDAELEEQVYDVLENFEFTE